MITPLDIQNKEFKKSIRGYKTTEVDKFLDEIIDDYERLYKENLELKDKILVLDGQIEQYNRLEKTLTETLVVAQNTADDVVRAARQKSEIINEEAELSAKEIIENAKEEVKRIQREYENLKKEAFIFRTRYKSFIEAQLITLDEFYCEIEKDISNETKDRGLDDYIDRTEDQDLQSENFEIEDINKNDNDLGV